MATRLILLLLTIGLASACYESKMIDMVNHYRFYCWDDSSDMAFSAEVTSSELVTLTIYKDGAEYWTCTEYNCKFYESNYFFGHSYIGQMNHTLYRVPVAITYSSWNDKGDIYEKIFGATVSLITVIGLALVVAAGLAVRARQKFCPPASPEVVAA